ncbi:hypothetical protein, partial [Helicobacter cinaedi]|uniref:hypothetical protein n=1 Tax=Helicobacter cinaedi TaxID=213 RepID=UPI0010582B96
VKNTHIKQRGGGHNLNVEKDLNVAKIRQDSFFDKDKFSQARIRFKNTKLKTLVFNIFTPHATIDSKTYKTYRNISILAILNICFIICVFSPYAIY